MRGPFLLALGVVVGVMGGVLLGFVLVPMLRPTPVHVSAATTSEPSRASKDTTRSSVDRGSTLGPASLSVPNREIEATSEADEIGALAERLALSLTEQELAANGSEWIRVRVEDPHGGAVAGATVRLVAQEVSEPSERAGQRIGGGSPSVTQQAEEIRRFLESYRKRHSAGRDAVTDARGMARFDGLASGDYRATVWCEGHTVQSVGRNLAPTGSDIVFVARPLASLDLEIRDANGRLAADGVLELVPRIGNQQQRFAWSRDEPQLWVPPGHSRARALDRNGMLASPWVDLDLVAGPRSEPLQLTLAVRPGIRCRVRDVSNRGERVHLSAAPTSQGEEPDLNGSAHRGSVDPPGEHRFFDLAPGRYVVGAGRARNEWEQIQVIEVTDHLVEVVCELPELDPSSVLLVTVAGPNGERPTTATFHLVYRSETKGKNSDRLQSVQRSDGRFEVRWPQGFLDWAADPGAGAESWLEVKHREWGETRAAILPNQRELSVQFQPPAFLTVTVHGYVGSGLERMLSAQLTAVSTDERESLSTPRASGSEQVDENGRVSLGPVRPADYNLILRSSGGRGWFGASQVSSTLVRLGPGENATTVALPTLHSLRVRLPGSARSWATLSREGNHQSFSEVTDGVAVFENLAAGTYRLDSWTDGEARFMTIEVPAAGVVDFVADPIDAFRVSIDDESGYLATAGLQQGDLLVAIGGVELESRAQMKLLLAQSVDDDSVEVTIQRTERTFSVALDPRMLVAEDELGGSLLPASR